MNNLPPSPPPFQRDEIASGIWKTRLGVPENAVPTAFRSAACQVEQLSDLPLTEKRALPELMGFEISLRGTLLKIGLSHDEHIFGFGLQLKSLEQTGKKRYIRVNSDPLADTGDSHAPIPFYISTAGYAVLIDTARYASFHVASHQAAPRHGSSLATENVSGGTPEELYALRQLEERSVMVEIPLAQGIDVYWFGGPDLRTALQRYNLFSGGGCLPPLAALGFWYRVSGHATQEEVIALVREFRQKEIPCDILGLEPGWQSHFLFLDLPVG